MPNKKIDKITQAPVDMAAHLEYLPEQTAHRSKRIETSTLKEAQEQNYKPKDGGINNVILKTTASLLIYFIIIVSIFLYVVGHDNPGGGFVAGLMLAGGVLLLYLCFGKPFAKNFSFDYKLLIPIGLSISFLTGMAGVVFGYPFLYHTFGYVTVPLFGSMHLTSASIFDLGVFLVVVGTTLTIILNIGENK